MLFGQGVGGGEARLRPGAPEGGVGAGRWPDIYWSETAGRDRGAELDKGLGICAMDARAGDARPTLRRTARLTRHRRGCRLPRDSRRRRFARRRPPALITTVQVPELLPSRTATASSMSDPDRDCQAGIQGQGRAGWDPAGLHSVGTGKPELPGPPSN